MNSEEEKSFAQIVKEYSQHRKYVLSAVKKQKENSEQSVHIVNKKD